MAGFRDLSVIAEKLHRLAIDTSRCLISVCKISIILVAMYVLGFSIKIQYKKKVNLTYFLIRKKITNGLLVVHLPLTYSFNIKFTSKQGQKSDGVL